MAKLSKEDKLHIFEEWKLKGTTYLSKKYNVNIAGISYLVALINKHDISNLDKGYTSYTKEFTEEAIKRVLLNGEAAYAVSLDLGLPSKSMLIDWIRYLSRSNYYDILKRDDYDDLKHHDMIERIKAIYTEIASRYVAPGYRMVTDHLHNEGLKVSRKTVSRLMRKFKLFGYSIKSKRKYYSYKGEERDRIKPDLVKRQFFSIRPNRLWYTDITEFNLRCISHQLLTAVDVIS